MPILLRRLLAAAVDTRWWFLIALSAVHYAVAWLGLVAFGEGDLTGEPFFYYYLTTVTTVGYGDLSPSGGPGRIFAAVWIMAVGVALFAAVLGKLVAMISNAWRRRLNGQGDFSALAGATVLIGWREARTERLIEELRADAGASAEIVLFTTKDVAPMADVRLVRAQKLTDTDALRRAGAAKAGRIIVYADDDDLTLSACLAAGAVNPDCHMVAYFVDKSTAELACAHCRNLETVSANSEELVVRATHDPGASAVLSALVSATDDRGTLFSVRAADLGAPFDVMTAQAKLREHGASLLAVRPAGSDIALCLVAGDTIAPDTQIFYVARHRLRLGGG